MRLVRWKSRPLRRSSPRSQTSALSTVPGELCCTGRMIPVWKVVIVGVWGVLTLGMLQQQHPQFFLIHLGAADYSDDNNKHDKHNEASGAADAISAKKKAAPATSATTADGAVKEGNNLIYHVNATFSHRDNNNDYNWLDQIVASQYPALGPSNLTVLYPMTWTLDPYNHQNHALYVSRNVADVMHAEWTPHPPRQTGRGPEAVDAAHGGVTVLGQWPDQITQLTLIALPKNAHTAMMNVMGDLRQRLSSDTSGDKQQHCTSEHITKRGSAAQRQRDAVMQHALNAQVKAAAAQQQAQQHAQQQSPADRHVVFAVVRDPVDRFISATCQEMIQGFRPRCSSSRPKTTTMTQDQPALQTLECAIDMVQTGAFRHHQQPQAHMIQCTVGRIAPINNNNQQQHLGVTLVPFHNATTALLRELGGAPDTQKTRDRTDPRYTTTKQSRGPFSGELCQLTPLDIPPELIQQICHVYRMDVQIMAWANMPSLHCPPLPSASLSQSAAAQPLQQQKQQQQAIQQQQQKEQEQQQPQRLQPQEEEHPLQEQRLRNYQNLQQRQQDSAPPTTAGAYLE